MKLMSRMFVTLKVTNVGNGPAVEIDFIPKIVQLKYSTNSSFPENIGADLVDSLGNRIECMSFKEGDTKEVMFVFFDEEQKFSSSILQEYFAYLTCLITFKKPVVMTFKENMVFTIYGNDSEAKKQFRFCLKLAKNAEIYFADKVKERERLVEKDRIDEASKIANELNNKMKKRYQECSDELSLGCELTFGSFSIQPIQKEEYKKIILENKKKNKKPID